LLNGLGVHNYDTDTRINADDADNADYFL